MYEPSVQRRFISRDVTERLSAIDSALWEKVKAVLDLNLKERHLRGGAATKRKYLCERDKTVELQKEAAIAESR